MICGSVLEMDELALTLHRLIQTRLCGHSQPHPIAIVRTVYQSGFRSRPTNNAIRAGLIKGPGPISKVLRQANILEHAPSAKGVFYSGLDVLIAGYAAGVVEHVMSEKWDVHLQTAPAWMTGNVDCV